MKIAAGIAAGTLIGSIAALGIVAIFGWTIWREINDADPYRHVH